VHYPHTYTYTIHTSIQTTMGEGLTRRRAGAGGSPITSQSDQIPSSSNHNSSSSSGNGNKSVPTPSASGTGGRVAYDPRDFQDDAESNKMPRLTLMEEVLLLGLKDKAVRQQPSILTTNSMSNISQPITLFSSSARLRRTDSLTPRATYHSGTTISPTLFEDVS
jgi:hypothetical protein